jgi:hypothetical protein
VLFDEHMRGFAFMSRRFSNASYVIDHKSCRFRLASCEGGSDLFPDRDEAVQGFVAGFGDAFLAIS